MNKTSKTILIVIPLIVLAFFSYTLKQQSPASDIKCSDESAGLQFFISETCPVCAKTAVFLGNLQQEYPDLKIAKCKISEQENVKKLLELYLRHDVPRDKYGTVPAIFTKNKYFIGFNDLIAQEIAEQVRVIERATSTAGIVELSAKKKTVKVPILGEVDAEKYSLPVLAAGLGFFDGFNICSLGALILILGLVLVLRDRKKMLLFGSAFILTTAVVYGLLIVLWYHLFVFLTPYLKAMEVLIGVLGVAGGIYFLRDFIRFKKQGPTCEIETGKGVMSRFSAKMKQTLQTKTSIIAIVVSILLFAVVITVAEFPCSAAVPLFFAGTLAEAGLPGWQYLLYIALFLLFYMLDEIVIFLIAVFTMTIKLANKKFVTWVTLVEAIVLFLLGFYYLFGFLIFH